MRYSDSPRQRSVPRRCLVLSSFWGEDRSFPGERGSDFSDFDIRLQSVTLLEPLSSGVPGACSWP